MYSPSHLAQHGTSCCDSFFLLMFSISGWGEDLDLYSFIRFDGSIFACMGNQGGRECTSYFIDQYQARQGNPLLIYHPFCKPESWNDPACYEIVWQKRSEDDRSDRIKAGPLSRMLARQTNISVSSFAEKQAAATDARSTAARSSAMERFKLAEMMEAMSKALPEEDCSFCGDVGAKKKCGSCRVAFYCNRGCQKLHWKKHKLECSPDLYRVVKITLKM
jgi:hypothetical protein